MSPDYWEQRYQNKDMPWEKGEPSPGLVDFLQAKGMILPKGKVLVPGCGTGHDVRAWAKAGFDALGLDISPTGIALAQESTAAAGIKAKFEQRDFLRDEPVEAFDWVFEHTLFCAIDPKDRDLYVGAVHRWLKAKGHFLAVFYLIPDEDGPPFGTNREELIRRFSPQFDLLEEWVPRSYPNRTGLELMMWWRKK
jgi:methyl halide transferase